MNLLADRAAEFPERIALADAERKWTWAQLHAESRMIAGRLQREHGILPGDVVATVLENSAEHVFILHAIFLCGAAAAPLNLRLSPPERERQLAHLHPRLLIAAENAAFENVQFVQSGLLFTQEREAIDQENRAPERGAIDQEHSKSETEESASDPGLHLDAGRQLAHGRSALEYHELPPDESRVCSILFTSGSSGVMKAVPHSWRNHRSSAEGSAANLGVREDDNWLCIIPLYHIGGLAIVTRSLIYGTAMTIQQGFEASAVLETLRRVSITLLSVVPTMLQRLIDVDRDFAAASLPALRAILLGGAAASQRLWEEALARKLPVLGTYGLTETCSQVVTASPDAQLSATGSAGRAIAGAEIRIRHERGESESAGEAKESTSAIAVGESNETAVSPFARGESGESESGESEFAESEFAESEFAGEAGEICIRGGMVTEGYFRNPSLTAERFVDGWFLTGDIGVIDADGWLHVLGRGDDMIVTGGENVYPTEIEDVLLRHPAVTDAAIAGVEDAAWGMSIAALVVLKESVDFAELETWCRAELAGYKIPRNWRSVDEIPRTASGKLIRGRIVGMWEEVKGSKS
ncbi:MAG: AMP-binding protein [Bacteroidota bacterium]